MKQINKKNRGFTLIELLVVVAIIGLLSSVVLTSLNTARSKARDAKRLSDIRQIEIALEQYYNDNGSYPSIVHGLGYDTECVPGYPGCGHCHRWCDLETALAPYINPLPREPLGTVQRDYHYAYSSNANDQMYGLMTVLENANSIAQNDGGYFASAFERGQRPSYCVAQYSGGDEDWLNSSGAWSNVCQGGN